MATKKYLDYESLKELVAKIRELVGDIGHFTYKGSVAAVADLPDLEDAANGWVYMFTAEAKTTADFVEGAGKKINANDEVICVETATDTLKWAILGPVFDVADKLTFGSTMPASPSDGDTFLYLGDTTYTYTYTAVTPDSGDNPQEQGWYESDGSGGYTLSTDTTVDTSKVYYEREATEQYAQGVIYVYDATKSEWVAKNSGDTMVPITKAEVDALFE